MPKRGGWWRLSQKKPVDPTAPDQTKGGRPKPNGGHSAPDESRNAPSAPPGGSREVNGFSAPEP